MKWFYSFILLFTASCAAAPIDYGDDGKTDFLNAVNKSWSAGSGSIIVVVFSISVQEKGKKIAVNCLENGVPRLYTFVYASQKDASKAYYRNTISPAAGIVVTRMAGLSISGGTLKWAGYISNPSIKDSPKLDSPQYVWDSFISRWWEKDNVNFSVSYAEIGK